MGEKQNGPFQLSFNASLKVDSQGSRVTSDGGLILVRELDERLGFGELITQHLSDLRRGKNTQLPLADLFRQSVYSRIAGYEDVNDAERLSQDPTFRLIGSEKIWDRGPALPLACRALRPKCWPKRRTSAAWPASTAGSSARRKPWIPRCGSFWTWTRPRFLCTVSRSRAPTTATSRLPAITRCCFSTAKVTVWLPSCAPTAFTVPKTGRNCCCQKLSVSRNWARKSCSGPTRPSPSRRFARRTEKRGVKYAVRIPANDSLELDIAELLTHPVGRPSHKPVVWYKGVLYQAASWKTARRVVEKVEFHFGELFPRVAFIVTNLETDSRAVVRFYNKRGTAEQWIKEGNWAVEMTRLSCHRFRSNAVRLWLSLIACNLGNLGRRLVLPKGIEGWSMTSLQQ